MLHKEASIFGAQKDQSYMQQALVQAQNAFDANEVPIGAIIVNSQGAIIARAYNQVETSHSQTAHAELLAIAQAGESLADWRLTDCWIYVTLQPCAMCMHALMASRIAAIVWGTQSPIFGYDLDNQLNLSLYKNDTLILVSSVAASQCAALLRKFFIKKRMSSRGTNKDKNNERLLIE